MINSSALSSGLAWSTRWERWNRRRRSNGKSLLFFNTLHLKVCRWNVFTHRTVVSSSVLGSARSTWSQRPLRTSRSRWPSGTSWWYRKPRCCRRKGKLLLRGCFSLAFFTVSSWSLVLKDVAAGVNVNTDVLKVTQTPSSHIIFFLFSLNTTCVSPAGN